MKRALLLFVLLAALLLSGCTDNLEHSLMVISMSVDKDEKGLTVCVKSPNYAAQSGGSSSSSGGSGGSGGGSGGSSGSGQQEQGYITLSVTGRDWAHALSVLNASTPRTLRFSHLREVVIGRKTAESSDFMSTLQNIDRLQNVRSHATVIVCEGEGKAFLEMQRAFIGARLSKYLDITLQNYEAKGYIPATTLGCALRDLSGDWRDPVVGFAAKNALNGESATSARQPVDLVAGELARQGVNAAEYAGGFAVGSVGNTLLTGYEMQLLHLLQGDNQTLVFAYKEKYYTAEPRAGQSIRVEERDGKCFLELKAPITIGYSIYGERPDDGAAAYIQKEIASLLSKLQSVGCDALGFGCVAARRFRDMHTWRAYDWPSRYAQAQIGVHVDAVMRQTSAL